MCEAVGFEEDEEGAWKEHGRSMEGVYSKRCHFFLCQGHGGALGNIWGCGQGDPISDQLVNIGYRVCT